MSELAGLLNENSQEPAEDAQRSLALVETERASQNRPKVQQQTLHPEAEAEGERSVLIDALQSGWQDILWQEWRHTGDEDYAEQLFTLIADEPVSRKATIVNVLLGALYGGMAGLLLALSSTLGTVPALTGQTVWPAFLGGGAFLGVVGGLLSRLLLQRRLPTKIWLAQLTANLAPHEFGIVGAGLAIQLIGGLVGWIAALLAGLGHTAGVIMLGIMLVSALGTKLIGWLLGFGREPNPRHLHQYRGLWLWWRKRPRGIEVEAALQQACKQQPEARQLWLELLQDLDRRKRDPASISEAIRHLQSLNWIDRFTAAHVLAASGGEGVTVLQPLATKITSPLRRTAIRLLQGIEQETTARLAHRVDYLLCPYCLTFFGPHKVLLPNDLNITYYGCRRCQQSRQYWEGQVIAILDADMGPEPLQNPETVRINWLAQRQRFDFHAVEIIRANDEDVERFAVQVGNDTDPARQSRYKQMRCVVAPESRLSENTVRILRHTFAEVQL